VKERLSRGGRFFLRTVLDIIQGVLKFIKEKFNAESFDDQ